MQRRFAAHARAFVYKCFKSAAAIALIAGLAVLNAEPANALSGSKSRFDIPAEDLGKALRDFAIQASCNISYDPASVEHLRAPAIKGEFTLSDALSRILSGTHLRGVNIDQNTIQVRAAGTSGADTSAPSAHAMIRLNYAKDAALQSADSDAQAQFNASTEVPSGERGAAANAPDDGKTPGLEEIVVTGTNITGVENKTIPLLAFDRDVIDRSGYANISDFINSLPQNVKSGPNSADGILTGIPGSLNNVENSTSANLRGLGASSTLTLVNGHRVAAASLGTGVDLSMIPISAVERIEVLTDGASAVYGADAVGGVVNIILRKDFNGEETSVRLDTLSRGGGELKQMGQSVGRTWDTGGALAVLQFEDSNVIRADQRSFTAAMPEPTDVFPSSKRYSGVLSAHQSIGASLELFGDALLEHNAGERSLTQGSRPKEQIIESSTNSTSADLGFRWQPFGDWHLEGNGLFSRINTLTSQVFIPSQPPYVNGEPYARAIDTIKQGDLKLDGTLWSSGGSSIKGVLGTSYRQEAFSLLQVTGDLNNPTSRHVHAAFAEIYAPLITSANALPGVRKLDFSAAVRNDSYSDFGSKTNPRFGVFWSPTDQFGFRAAYSTSFRAPDPSELFSLVSSRFILIESGFPQPNDPTGKSSALFFGNQSLQPETSKNLTAGIDFSPAALSGTQFSLNYYRIIYANRIISPPINANIFINPQIYGPLIKQFPNDAAVEAFVAGLDPPQQILDFSAGQTGLSGIRYGYSYSDVNAARQKTEGIDLGAHSLIQLDNTDKLILDFNATYIRELETSFCETCAKTDLVNTYGEPLKLRLRASGGWSNGMASTNAAINFANAYSDTNLVPPGRISSFTTLDLNAGWLFRATGTTLSLNILNALNSDPPHTAFAIEQIHYDPINADPRGRTLSLQVRQSW
jgi:iron complex outermembrane recepter protein